MTKQSERKQPEGKKYDTSSPRGICDDVGELNASDSSKLFHKSVLTGSLCFMKLRRGIFLSIFLTHNITHTHKTNTLKECSMPPGGSTVKGNFTQEYFSSMYVWPHEIGSAVQGKGFRGVEIVEIPLGKSMPLLLFSDFNESLAIHYILLLL